MARYQTTALSRSGIIVPFRGQLQSVRWIYTGTVATKFYIQLFDSTTVPADTTVPSIVFAGLGSTTADQSGLLDLSGPGIFFPASTGLSWALSSTLATKTQVASDFVWLEATYVNG